MPSLIYLLVMPSELVCPARPFRLFTEPLKPWVIVLVFIPLAGIPLACLAGAVLAIASSVLGKLVGLSTDGALGPCIGLSFGVIAYVIWKRDQKRVKQFEQREEKTKGREIVISDGEIFVSGRLGVLHTGKAHAQVRNFLAGGRVHFNFIVSQALTDPLDYVKFSQAAIQYAVQASRNWPQREILILVAKDFDVLIQNYFADEVLKSLGHELRQHFPIYEADIISSKYKGDRCLFPKGAPPNV